MAQTNTVLVFVQMTTVTASAWSRRSAGRLFQIVAPVTAKFHEVPVPLRSSTSHINVKLSPSVTLFKE